MEIIKYITRNEFVLMIVKLEQLGIQKIYFDFGLHNHQNFYIWFSPSSKPARDVISYFMKAKKSKNQLESLQDRVICCEKRVQDFMHGEYIIKARDLINLYTQRQLDYIQQNIMVNIK